MKNSRIIFDHVKHLKDWTLVCHVYDSKYRKVLTICVVTCNLKMTQLKLNAILQKIRLRHVREQSVKLNFKGFMAYNAQTNWNAIRKIYGVGDPNLSMVGHERTYLSRWLNKVELG